MRLITEGSIKLQIPDETKISKKLPVFYNPVMKFNRDISIALLNAIADKKMLLALPLAGSGIRGLRFLKELKKGKIDKVIFNDYKPDFFQIIEAALELNKIKPSNKIALSNMDANQFMLFSEGFNYIDVDPFGTPNPFLDLAVKRVGRNGILAVTATDTSALAGTYPDACKRKYWAVPLRNEEKHEIGLRILIRKVQLFGAQFEKALIPIYSFSRDHYMRIFFRCQKGKKKVDEIINQHDFYSGAGPLWTGQLWDAKLAKKIVIDNFTSIIAEESKKNIVGFYHIHKICKKNQLPIPRFEDLINKIKKKKYFVSRTHFDPLGIKSDISIKELLNLIKNINKK